MIQNQSRSLIDSDLNGVHQKDLNDFNDDDEDLLLSISNGNASSIEYFRKVKLEIEDEILPKLLKIDDKNVTQTTKKVKLCYYRDFYIDKIGLTVKVAETAISEGWQVPKYENEFQNLLGLPITEDTPTPTMRLQRPQQECFNCLSTAHKITECPIKMDHERIEMHRKNYATQQAAAQEQMQLFSSRYTNDDKPNRGFTPGRISESLKHALGLNPKQLPPYVYIMRELGYPPGWLVEAKVKKSGLSVNGEDVEEIEQEIKGDIYDPDKIIGFIGFNEAPPSDTIDESHSYGVRRYNERLSKNEFLKKLRLIEPQKRKNRKSSGRPSTNNQKLDDSIEIIEDDTISITTDSQLSTQEATGEAVDTIKGTPIVINECGVDSVPDSEKFSVGICAHKPYEMCASANTANYKAIVEITRKINN